MSGIIKALLRCYAFELHVIGPDQCDRRRERTARVFQLTARLPQSLNTDFKFMDDKLYCRVGGEGVVPDVRARKRRRGGVTACVLVLAANGYCEGQIITIDDPRRFCRGRLFLAVVSKFRRAPINTDRLLRDREIRRLRVICKHIVFGGRARKRSRGGVTCARVRLPARDREQNAIVIHKVIRRCRGRLHRSVIGELGIRPIHGDRLLINGKGFRKDLHRNEVGNAVCIVCSRECY